MPARALALGFVGLVACGGKYPETKTTPKPAANGDESAMPAGGIVNAALPYQIVDARTGRQVDETAFWTKLTATRAICVGEDHPNPHHHWVQLHVVQELVKRLPPGTKLAVGMEMFQRPFQGVLDDYVAKRIDVEALKSRSGWEVRWGYDFGFYGPTMDAAIAGGGTVLALNAPRELTKKVVRQGLESLTPEEKAQVPELVLDDPKHRAWFDGIMSDIGGPHGHGGHSESNQAAPHGDMEMPSADRVYTVQVMWDETMADGGAKWLAANPTGHLVVIAGNGHCHDSAIVGRLIRRGVTDAISVHPVLDAEDNVSVELAKPMNDFLVVLQLPK